MHSTLVGGAVVVVLSLFVFGVNEWTIIVSWFILLTALGAYTILMAVTIDQISMLPTIFVLFSSFTLGQ